MLEYLAKADMKDSDIFVLVQATSPLTESVHFSEALDMYQRGDFDSILTCVRNYRFFWNDNGTPMNYDYRNRPRRQNFKGMYMENGAFYINTVANILRDKNRLSGRIGIYEMPEYTATEIDEPDDWTVLENLKYRHMLKHEKDYSKIRLFLSDVDGVLTDGGMYYSEKGDELKKFNTRDGMAFKLMREHGIKTGIVTSEDTQIVERRSEKLKLDFCVQGKREGGKLAAAEDICKKLGVTLTETAYVGDDINDIDLLQKVGFPFCPSDAQQNIKKIVNIEILDVRGGNAVIRRIWDLILNAEYK
jgi:N-acylneuraminate cytidylyltransferase